MAEEQLLLLDACCAINVLASGVAEEILRVLPYEVAAAELVVDREVLALRAESPKNGGDAEDDAEEVTLQPLVDAGLLQVLAPADDEEQAMFVALALQLDDGEAMTGALAIHREGVVATDDRKAIRVLTEEVEPGVKVLRTSELVKTWADTRDCSPERVREALEAIEMSASFIPPRNDPLEGWWWEARRRT